MSHPGDVTERRRRIFEMVEDHDDHGKVERICPERKSVAIAPHAPEPTFCPGDGEHRLRRIEGDDAIRHGEELRKSTGPRSEIQDAVPIPQAADFDECAEPELAVQGLVGPNAIVVRGMSRIVNGHTTCKR